MSNIILERTINLGELLRLIEVGFSCFNHYCVGCGRCYVSCYDAAHQAIDWNEEKRRPELNDNCVGCHLCLNVCPVQECITPGEIKWKEGRTQTEISFRKRYE